MSDASLAPAVLENSGAIPPAPWPLVEACGLPEIGSRLSGLSVRIDPELTRPFTFDGAVVAVRPDRAATVTGSALILREAIELHASGIGQGRWPQRILAHATAVVFGATTLLHRDEVGARRAFSPLTNLADEIIALHDEPGSDAAYTIAGHIAEFLRERDETDEQCTTDELDQAARALAFAPPTEVLLTCGGDHRQTVDWRLGTNSYGIPPGPTPWTSLLGSCTASSPTTRAFGAAANLRRRLIEAAYDDDLERFVTVNTSVMRRTLLAALGVSDETTEVVFTPSGTDAELVTLAVSMAEGEPVHSIVVGPLEIGSGSTNAAAGRHFGTRVPTGRTAAPGEPIDGLDGSDVIESTIDIRDADGRLLSPDEMAVQVEAAIERHASTHRTLVHVVEGSKTGVRLPRPEAVQEWKRRFGARLDVVVDAAQMRIDQQTVTVHLDSGSMVIVTGSKFFGGPPFSGAILIPSSLTDRLTKISRPPSGLIDYLTRAEVPETLTDLRAVAKPGFNAGLLLRWEAALAEMRSFHNVSPEIRDEVVRLLVTGLRKTVDRTDVIDPVDSLNETNPDVDRRGLDDLPTIFTFFVKCSDGRHLTVDEGRSAYLLLSKDLKGIIPVDDAVVSRTFQLGQPVKIYRRGDGWIGALRVAIGAATVSEIVFDYRRGRTWIERIDRTLADVDDALRKLQLIVKYVNLEDIHR